MENENCDVVLVLENPFETTTQSVGINLTATHLVTVSAAFVVVSLLSYAALRAAYQAFRARRQARRPLYNWD